MTTTSFRTLLGDTPELRLIEFILPCYGIIYTESELISIMEVAPDRGRRLIAQAVDLGLITVFDPDRKTYRLRDPGESAIMDTIDHLKTIIARK